MTRQVFLDHQSSTPVLPEVFEAMRPFFTERFGNASSLHHYGMEARDALAKAREQAASMIGAESPEEILFTSNGTEAVNLAIKGTAWAAQRHGNHIVVSEIEHPAVLNSVEFLEKQGFVCTRIKVDGNGFVAPRAVQEALTEKTILVCIHHANHDIGTIQPVREISEITAERGIPLFVDAVASAGWLPVSVQESGASLVALSPHKFYGPKGVGILYRNRRARVTNLTHGGNQEGGRRAGTENLPAIVGAGMACETAVHALPERMAHVVKLQKRLWELIEGKLRYIRLNGPCPGAQRIGTNLNLSVEFVEGEGLVLSLDMKGVALASGTSCVSRSLKVSHVLAAIGLDHSLAQGAILMTLGKDNTEQDLDYVVDSLADAVTKLRGMSATWDDFTHGTIKSLTDPPKAVI